MDDDVPVGAAPRVSVSQARAPATSTAPKTSQERGERSMIEPNADWMQPRGTLDSSATLTAHALSHTVYGTRFARRCSRRYQHETVTLAATYRRSGSASPTRFRASRNRHDPRTHPRLPASPS